MNDVNGETTMGNEENPRTVQEDTSGAMTMSSKAPAANHTSRRAFLARCGAAGIAAGTAGGWSVARAAHAAGSDVIKIALIGCGARGTGAASQALAAKAPVKLVAMADVFAEHIQRSLENMSKNEAIRGRIDVPPERQFVGFEAYKQALQTDIDVAFLTTPQGFRPIHFEAAVKAGKNVFMEKPLAIDAPGVRRVQAANEEAKRRGLRVAVGLNMRHQPYIREMVARVHDGAIGQIHFLRAYTNLAGLSIRPRQPGDSEFKYQTRNWYFFLWTCGDHIVDQAIHSLDAINWLMNDAHPIRAQGMGGRQVRVGPDYGEIYDHHAVEYDYADGVKLFSYARQIPACWQSFSQAAHATRGTAEIVAHVSGEIRVAGQPTQRWKKPVNSHQAEQDDFFAALVRNEPYNEADYGANSTMTAILGRMATYSGQVVTWDEALRSNLDLSPKRYAFDAEPPVHPDAQGMYPSALPGITRAW
jgi:predicted dehydrogenase